MTDAWLPHEILAALAGDDPHAFREVLLALESGRLTADAAVVERLVELLAEASKEVRRRAAGALGLAVTEADHRASLARVLSDDEPQRRWGAAFALARAGFGGADVARAAIEALGDEDGDVRWAAAGIVCTGASSDDTVLEMVLTAARTGASPQRKMAIYCARNLSAGDADLYLAALRDGDTGVRLAALSGLSRLLPADARSVEALVVSMRGDVDAGVRRAAAAALGKIGAGADAAREALEEVERSTDDADLRRAARAALRAIVR
jgi:HEAT repeat protein